MAASGSNGSSGSNNPLAWLGLLKWSLNYVDGTKESSPDMVPMSQEDREFLEKVMKEGIIDENERMKFILQEFTKALDYYTNNNNTNADASSSSSSSSSPSPIDLDELEDLLQELRDIVEQIDFARAFCSMKGLPFLLGCLQHQLQQQQQQQNEPQQEESNCNTATTNNNNIPNSITNACLGLLSTLSQNNPQVQTELLELGGCKVLTDLFFHDETSNTAKAKIMQAISSMVRNNEMAEQVFMNLPQAPMLFMEGLKIHSSTTTSLRSKTLFFFKAFVTADTSTLQRVAMFQIPIFYIMDHYLLSTNANGDIATDNTNESGVITPDQREMAISLFEQLLGRKLLSVGMENNDANGSSSTADDSKNDSNRTTTPKSDNTTIIVLSKERKHALVGQAVQRIATIRSMEPGDEKEFAEMEKEHWENLLLVLSNI